MIIIDTEVSFMKRSIRYSGLPKGNTDLSYERADRLSRTPSGSGHDCFLKGIVVAYYLQADHSFWLQWQRYHFHDIVSSESKMHSIGSMEFKWNKSVVSSVKYEFENDIFEQYKKGVFDFEQLIMSCPIGLELGADIRSNYLQLKSIYHQRKNHKMSSWIEFCLWIEELPNSHFITGKKLENI